MSTIVLEDEATKRRHVIEVRRLLVAGFTGRDLQAVREHVRELADLGVPAPDRTPTLYEVDPAQLRQTSELVVCGGNTSGEVEPVLVVTGGEQLLTVGSDHTDRDVERVDIAQSKRATDKVIGTRCFGVADVRDRWDEIELVSEIDGAQPYQTGTLASLTHIDTLLAHLRNTHGLELADGDAVFLGTIPVNGAIRPSDTFSGTLRVPGRGEISLTYRVTDVGRVGRSPLRKPEIEFRPVTEAQWVRADPGVEGQWERILAADPATGVGTRILRFDPGTDTSPLGIVRHEFWEEVYILEGAIDDLTLGQRFSAGMYACRPPGMPHGPWRSESGCITFEVRYPPM